MKKILGLDLGTTSIGWAVVNEAENDNEQSSVVRLGVRVNPLTTDEQTDFEKGKPISTNANRTLKRGMRRSLQRYKLRRQHLVDTLKSHGWITDDTLLSEQGNHSTFETYRLRAKAATEEITLEQFARVLLMINKKRGYKSNRKAKGEDEGTLIDGMTIAKTLYDDNITPGQYVMRLLQQGKCYVPDFYRSDLRAELDRIWAVQHEFHPDLLTSDFCTSIQGKSKTATSKIFLGRHQIFSLDIKGTHIERLQQLYQLRCDALVRRLEPSELATVVSEVNGQISSSSGYLGTICDRSKELFFHHQTIGQRLMDSLDKDPNRSLKNQPFYRQDYLDEFERLWETQRQFHPELTPELKHDLRDTIIFYQRRLKSQKGLVSRCEFEHSRRVCPKSSPLFQEFRIRQVLNNVKVSSPSGSRFLDDDERQTLFHELQLRPELKKAEALKLLFDKPRGLDLNYDKLEGNRTMAALLQACQNVIEMSGHGEFDFAKSPASTTRDTVERIFKHLGFATDWLDIDTPKTGRDLDHEPQYRLWHLLYSYEGDNSKTGDESLVDKLSQLLKMPQEYARIFAAVSFEPDYGSLSAKAIQNTLPHLQAGHIYSEACALAGYRHSAQSLTSEENDSRPLKDRLALLPKNSLRNPVVEKILNQMVNVVNGAIDQYGRPDEVRIEMARELKKSAAERQEAVSAISKNTKEQEEIAKKISRDFGFPHVSRTDITRYRLYKELEQNGSHTLYSNTYIPYEKIFSKEFDIEHIIPQARLFDDSFSNKTLELRSVNIEKGNTTALDFVRQKYGDAGLASYKARVNELLKNNAIGKTKAKKLLMSETDIPKDFIDRDLRNTQYIARQALSMLRQVSRTVTATTGSITDRLREDWGLVNVMQELNWDKYNRQGLTEIIEGRDGQQIRRINDWTKRNDHRHHAMDALTIAFTKPSYIQYLNNLNARTLPGTTVEIEDRSRVIRAIEQKELTRDDNHHLIFKPPFPFTRDTFRAEAKRQLEAILVSIKAKNKVVTRHTNVTRTAGGGTRRKVQLTPRGQLHNETVCSRMLSEVSRELAVGSKMTLEEVAKVKNPRIRQALRLRLETFGGDSKKAFTGKNSPQKDPIYIDDLHTETVPPKVALRDYETIYTVRKPVNKGLNLDKVVDQGIKRLLQARLDEYGGNADKAFSNLDENPIWLNREKGICVKSVRVKLLNNAVALHDRRDKEGRLITDSEGKAQPADYVNPGNNHHVAIFADADGNLQEHIVSFYEATSLAIQGLPVVDKEYHKADGWTFRFTLKQNEYFVFPAPNFDPAEIDLTDEKNYPLISPHLFRVQKLSSKYYVFRHHLETNVEDTQPLRNITWIRIQNENGLRGIVKVRVNHTGQIVAVGEY